jgi:hypothetical protein
LNDMHSLQQKEISGWVSVLAVGPRRAQNNTDRAILSAPYITMQTLMAAWH